MYTVTNVHLDLVDPLEPRLGSLVCWCTVRARWYSEALGLDVVQHSRLLLASVMSCLVSSRGTTTGNDGQAVADE